MNLMAERTELLWRYRQLRAAMRELHSELMGMVPKDTFTECGQKLGFLVDGTLVFETEDEMSVLMDYCLYDAWSGQHNAVTRFLAKQPYAAGTDQALLLDAMSRARYSLFQVESVAEGLGVNCRDILRGDGGTIVDEGLGNNGHSRRHRRGPTCGAAGVEHDDGSHTGYRRRYARGHQECAC